MEGSLRSMGLAGTRPHTTVNLFGRDIGRLTTTTKEHA